MSEYVIPTRPGVNSFIYNNSGGRSQRVADQNQNPGAFDSKTYELGACQAAVQMEKGTLKRSPLLTCTTGIRKELLGLRPAFLPYVNSLHILTWSFRAQSREKKRS